MVENIFILAGGSGTRLWPASNRAMPKQFLEVQHGKSLLLLTLERALSLNVSGEIYIITVKEQMTAVINECLKLESGSEKIVVLPEPEAKNTAPALAAAAGYLRGSGRENEKVLVMPADHLITPVDQFGRDVEKADNLAGRGFLVTFGVKPLYPATGYGYIESGEKEGKGFRVHCFREKPDRKTAEKFIEQGRFYWNSGMFVFSVKTFWNELAVHSPSIAEIFSSLDGSEIPEKIRGITVVLDTPYVRELYASSPNVSIDYAIMEKSTRTAVVPAEFTWNDIGSWDEMAALYDVSDKETAVSIESENNFVFSDIPVALCGVNDLIVVQKNGALLICKKGKGQLVKEAASKFHEKV